MAIHSYIPATSAGVLSNMRDTVRPLGLGISIAESGRLSEPTRRQFSRVSPPQAQSREQSIWVRLPSDTLASGCGVILTFSGSESSVCVCVCVGGGGGDDAPDTLHTQNNLPASQELVNENTSKDEDQFLNWKYHPATRIDTAHD